MSTEARSNFGPTSPANDFFLLMFQTADFYSSFWQPFLKGMGRYQMEVAHLAAKQGQAMLHLGHTAARSGNPLAIIDAQMNFWQQTSANAAEAGRNMGQAIARAAQPPAGIEFFPAPKPRQHDMLRLEDRTEAEYNERVAA